MRSATESGNLRFPLQSPDTFKVAKGLQSRGLQDALECSPRDRDDANGWVQIGPT